MAWFQISDFQRVRMEWLIDAQDEDAARERFLNSEGQTFIVTQSVEDSDGVSVEPWDGPAPDRSQAGDITDAAGELYRALRAVLPYAAAYAEHVDNTSLPPGADGIFAAVDAAKALLASLEASPRG